jgi:hypothetical protein
VNLYAYWPDSQTFYGIKTNDVEALRSLEAAEFAAASNPLARVDELVDIGAINEARALRALAQTSRPRTSTTTASSGVIKWGSPTKSRAIAQPQRITQRRAHRRRPQRRVVGASCSTTDPPSSMTVALDSLSPVLTSQTQRSFPD